MIERVRNNFNPKKGSSQRRRLMKFSRLMKGVILEIIVLMIARIVLMIVKY